MSDIEFKGDTEKEKELNKEIFNCTLTIAQKDDEIRELKNQLQQKENIIKEVREKVNTIQFEVRSNNKKYSNLYITLKSTLQGQELLEILDKENK